MTNTPTPHARTIWIGGGKWVPKEDCESLIADADRLLAEVEKERMISDCLYERLSIVTQEKRGAEEKRDAALVPVTEPKANNSLHAENERLRAALKFYEKHVGGCQTEHRGHHENRQALVDDAGAKARAALKGGDRDGKH